MANEQENPLGKLATPMRIAVALAAAGHGNNEIGFRLGLSAQSVRTARLWGRAVASAHCPERPYQRNVHRRYDCSSDEGHQGQGSPDGCKKRRVVERDPSEWIDIPNASPALISKTQFAQVQAILNDPARKRRGMRSQVYKLSGRIRCGECQSPVTGQTLEKGRYVYYRCRDSYNPHSATECDAKYIPRDSLETAVFDALVAVLTDSSRLDDEIRCALAADGPPEDTSRVERELKAIKEKQRRLVDAYLNPDLPQDALAEQAKRLSQRKLTLETQLSKLQATNVALDVEAWLNATPAIAEHVRNWVAQAQDNDLDLLLQALDVRVTATRERAVIDMTVLLARLVQMLNLVTTARTSASPHGHTPAPQSRSHRSGGTLPAMTARSSRGLLSPGGR
jgi:hypothetical protein